MEHLLKQLLGKDNSLRGSAEQTIADLEKTPETYLIGLMNVCYLQGERVIILGSSYIDSFFRS